MKTYTLKELCKKCGVTRRGVQWYEKNGLVQPNGKNKMGHLLYDEMIVLRVTEIKALQDYGLSVAEIKAFFESDSVRQRAMLIRKYDELKEKCARMTTYIAEIELLIKERAD